MRGKYVKLNKRGMWHVETEIVWTMCGRSPRYKLATGWEPWAAVADELDGPLCKVCAKSLAVWERLFGER